MPTANNFISYARADSAFALKLAKDLREAGANAWIDQLEIRGGRNWNAAIQDALNSAQSILVILSSESVSSENVIAEFSYALENNKIVIPILLSNCTIPFRLNIFQRVDFTGEYQTGLNYLLEALDLTIEQPIKLKEFVPGNKPIQTTIFKKLIINYGKKPRIQTL